MVNKMDLNLNTVKKKDMDDSLVEAAEILLINENMDLSDSEKHQFFLLARDILYKKMDVTK